MITVEKVYKTYGKKESAYEALRGVGLTIKDGESLAIVGRSGSGKSTLMHLLAGLDHPSKGKVAWDGNSLKTMGERKLADLRNQRIGFVFQQFFCSPR
jgi:putative ABC transport system ATP-binding protein